MSDETTNARALVAAYLEKQDLRQGELARIAGIAPTKLSEILTGSRRLYLEEVRALAKTMRLAFNVTLVAVAEGRKQWLEKELLVVNRILEARCGSERES